MRFGALLDESNATVESILAEGMEPDAPDLLERLRTLVRAHAREEAAAGVAGRGASPAGWDASGPLGRIVDARLKESYVLSIALRRLPRPDAPAEVDDLWRGAIRNRLGENVAVVLAGLRAATHAPDFDRISLRVFDADRRVRAAAVDILDEICPDEIRALVLPLLEEEHMSEGERAARRRYGDLGGADPVAALFEIPDDWVRACTAYAVAHLTPSRYVGQLKAHEASADRFLAFSAAYALGRT